MRIEEENHSILEELNRENDKLTKKCNELNKDLIVYKDRNQNMVKAIVTLSIITFISLAILVICGYNYASDLAEKNFKLNQHEKIAQEQKETSEDMSSQIEDYKYQIEHQDNTIKDLREENNELKEENINLKSKLSNMTKTIDNQKSIIDRYRNKESNNNDYYEE